MNPATYFSKLGPTRKQIVMVSVLLTVLAQIVSIFIGLSYLNNMNEIVREKRESNVSNQFYKNTLTKFGELNNLMQVLQTPDYIDFFKGFMNIRDDRTVASRKAELLQRMNGLQLPSGMVKRIYFIGSDVNQAALIKDTDNEIFTELPYLRMEMLENLHIDQIFLRDNNQLANYSRHDFEHLDRNTEADMNKESKAELNAFIDNIVNKPIITNGNINGVLIIMELNQDMFRSGLPDAYSGYFHFSIVNAKDESIWSSDGVKQPPTYNAFQPYCSHCIQTEKALKPYPYRIIYIQSSDSVPFSTKSVLFLFILLSCLTAFATCLISYYYAKKIVYPFLMLAKKLKDQSKSNELVFKYISNEWLRKGLDSLSLRNKLIVFFTISVIIPTISNGYLYSRVFNQAIQSQMKVAVNEVGDFMNVSILNRMNSMNLLMSQISVSQQLQQYLAKREVLDSLRLSEVQGTNSPVTLSMFPSWNEVQYFVLFDSSGQGIYSSIFPNNLDLFKIDTEDVKHSDGPNWISGYKDVYNHTTPALIQRIQHWRNGSLTSYYLMLVPRVSLFSEISPIESIVQISDLNGRQIYAFNPYSTEHLNRSALWSGQIPNTKWQLNIEFSIEDIVLKTRQYYYSFAFIIVLILAVSIVISYIITSFLLKPIELLKRTILMAGEGDFSRVISYNAKNEIGEIIRNYNEMIYRLNEMIRENMRITEENANNKLRENELISLKTQAELKMLQAQINPHFLYNTLEAINMRSKKDGNREISQIVGSLAEMFRYSVSNEVGKVPLAMELAHVENYISIQQIRYGGVFWVELDVPMHLKNIAVVKFILQPIVENCFKHGLSGFEEGGFIRITAEEKDALLYIEISDNGIGMDQETVAKVNDEIRNMKNNFGSHDNKGGIGLSNVYHRLHLCYKEQAAMRISSSPMKGTKVTVSFPAETYE
ncbi:sensor histidine kinase [Paenibacillus andongensis]|uniref:sensor histidine kinase n=1 Tax=Paenibacillus andongensis TaxID=2975482 RepID=UPI0021BB0F7F|nr:sensor histidine kinase [Paenibacillus andongensis]